MNQTTIVGQPEQNHFVYWICCAPGLKLCAIADFLPHASQQPSSAVVVGAVVSERQIAICKKIQQKDHFPITQQQTDEATTEISVPKQQSNHAKEQKIRMRLYCADGTTFVQPSNENQQLPKLIFDSQAALEETGGNRKCMDKSARAGERKHLKSLATMDFDCDDRHQPQPFANNSHQVDDSAPRREATAKHQPWKAKLFDRVLVDVECSTDGSLKHIANN
ncbi:Nucleolar protein [Seminavis robusta]|uniref:Nucleolar protein n=1 Tax=Seminavis robusta TaxID=568900 RepID=A0A9N8H285_9STRA|nr:Nucleolar protein [Seminavis robusta]|eukprot:Sro14_g010660.1 Nucleolar protein (221) ;mRNA; r:110842-111504